MCEKMNSILVQLHWNFSLWFPPDHNACAMLSEIRFLDNLSDSKAFDYISAQTMQEESSEPVVEAKEELLCLTVPRLTCTFFF